MDMRTKDLRIRLWYHPTFQLCMSNLGLRLGDAVDISSFSADFVNNGGCRTILFVFAAAEQGGRVGKKVGGVWHFPD